MRRLMTALVIGTTLLDAAAALARTPAATCRSACAPRMAEQCDGLAGGARRRCRRPLLRACRQSTPLVACESTAALAAALAEHVLRPGDGAIAATPPVALCASGRFTTSVT